MSPVEIETVKVLPSPGKLCTVSSPPSAVTICLEIASPRPVPPYFRVVELSACVNGWNRRASDSGQMPMPVSVTSTPQQTDPIAIAARTTRQSVCSRSR